MAKKDENVKDEAKTLDANTPPSVPQATTPENLTATAKAGDWMVPAQELVVRAPVGMGFSIDGETTLRVPPDGVLVARGEQAHKLLPCVKYYQNGGGEYSHNVTWEWRAVEPVG